MRSDDFSIRESILACGVPLSCAGTTLPLLGQQPLRDHVLSRAASGASSKGLFLYPDSVRSKTHAIKVFNVLAKEFVLAGRDIHILSLTRLVRNVLGEDEDYNDDLGYRVGNAEIVMLAGFYDVAFKKNPHTEAQVFEFYDWLTNSWLDGRIVYFLADATVQRCTSWWDTALLSLIEEHVDTYTVAGAV